MAEGTVDDRNAEGERSAAPLWELRTAMMVRRRDALRGAGACADGDGAGGGAGGDGAPRLRGLRRERRLKCTGMRWSVAGANAVIWVRCARLSGWFDDYWEDRLRRAA